MPFEQLNLLDVEPEAPARPPRRRRSKPGPSRATASAAPPVPPGAVVVTHTYPQAWALLCEHGSDAVAVLHALAVDAAVADGALVVTASTRGLAERLGFLSKDTVHRRLRQLRRAGLIEALPGRQDRTDAPAYVLRLDGTGLSVASHDPNG